MNGSTIDLSSSVLIERNTTSGEFLNFCFTCSYRGYCARHGPHHVAQKSKITTFPSSDDNGSFSPFSPDKVKSKTLLACALGSAARSRDCRSDTSAVVRS